MTQGRDPETGRMLSTFDAETFEAVCLRVEAGEFTAPILRELGIAPRTWYDWLKDEARATRYGQAKDHGEEVLLAGVIQIADDATNDYMETQHGPALNAEHVSRSKLRIETRLKALAKFNPGRWGDKIEHSGKMTVSHEEFLARLPDPAAKS